MNQIDARNAKVSTGTTEPTTTTIATNGDAPTADVEHADSDPEQRERDHDPHDRSLHRRGSSAGPPDIGPQRESRGAQCERDQQLTTRHPDSSRCLAPEPGL